MEIYSDGTITLRTWQLEDAASLAGHANNIHIWNNVRDYFPHPYTLKDAEEYIAFTSQKAIPEDFAIVIDGKAVGGMGFIPQADVERFNAEIGYWIGEAYWNKGIVSKSIRQLICHIFTTTHFTRLFAIVYAFNTGSTKVLEKNSFTLVGVMRKAVIKNNQFLDVHLYELLKEDWK